jgi:hypothetical protein
MKSVALCQLVFSAAAVAQSVIPPGTVLPARLNSSLNSKSRLGQTITARIMQDVPLPSKRKIPAGTKVVGHVVSVHPLTIAGPSKVTVRFDALQHHHESIAISTNLRALASMMEVADAQVPPTGPDRGTPWAWRTGNLIGGEVAYGEGGPVVRGTQVVGRALADGVLLRLDTNSSSGCRGEFPGNNEPQALWVFSSNACGVYGMEGVQIAHAGRIAPHGEITFISKEGNLKIPSGSGMLLRVNRSD